MHEFFFSKLDKSPKYGKWISSIPVICVWMFLIFLTSLFFIFPCPELSHDYILIPIIQGIITLYTVANLFLATFLDPGALPKESIEVSDTQPPHYQHTEINGVTVRMKWCATCHFYRPPRTSHCAVCDHCVEMFDHHCPLINNCVGKRNYRCFFTFLTFLCIHMITIFNFNIMYLLRQRSNLLHGGAIVTIILNTAIVFLFIPFLKLFCFHVYLVSGGRTTKEWCDGKFHNSNNPFSKGWKMNIYSRLCGTQYPRLSDPYSHC